MKGAILEKGFKHYTYLNEIFPSFWTVKTSIFSLVILH